MMLSTLTQNSLHGLHEVCHSTYESYGFKLHVFSLDSPGVPVSATSKELFRGFSYIAPVLKEVYTNTIKTFYKFVVH